MIIFISGVSGSGKTTVGQRLSEQIGLPFFDADDFHPAANIEKMRAGQPLADDDRAGWLAALNTQAQTSARERGAVFACSALKKKYRDQLKHNLDTPVHFFLIHAPYELILSRLEARSGHYMPPALLQSQFDILEITDEIVLVSGADTVVEIVSNIIDMATGFSDKTE